MDTSKLKPFNLEEAKAGKSVVHGQFGRPVMNITEVGERIAFQFTDDGNNSPVFSVRSNEEDRNSSLCMAPTKRTVWVNVYQEFASQEEADRACSDRVRRIGGKAYPITITE